MMNSLFASASTEPQAISAAELLNSVDTHQKDLQTGVLELNFSDRTEYHLLFVRGQLVNVYRHAQETERLSSTTWAESLPGSRRKARLRSLALTPQAVRLVKILLEQGTVRPEALPEDVSLENQFENWMKHPVPSLAHLRWPTAEALVLLPGENAHPHYTLFVSPNQILHSAGGMLALYGWKEPGVQISLLSSDARTCAWEEYLLHYCFSQVISHLLERFVDLLGAVLVKTAIREINFFAAAQGWNISLAGTSVTDQAIFSSPAEATEAYARLLEILVSQTELCSGRI